MKAGRFVFCLLLVAVGCDGLRGIRPRPWPELHVEMSELAERYPHAPAVVLRREDRYRYTPASDAYWIAERYEAIAILTEGGERYAEIAIPLGASKLIYVRARTILPDGATQEVQPSEVHEVAALPAASWLSGAKRAARVFRLPNVHPGSIVEYTYAYGDSDFHYALRDVVSGPIPVRSYHFEISDAGPYAIAGKVYNIDGKIHAADGKATFDLKEIPARQDEPFAPPPPYTEPWWAIVVSAVQGLPMFATWRDALAPITRDLYISKAPIFDGLSARPALSGCARGSQCAIERALEWVQRETDLTGFVFAHPQLDDLRKALAAHAVNSTEKALLLLHALEALGVRARFALAAREPEHAMDPAFPSPFAGDQLVLVVDNPVPGKQRLFLDPSCEWCRVGQIPPWLDGERVLLFTPTTDMSDHVVAATEWLPVDGEVTPMSVDRRVIEARLDPGGAVDGSIQRELGGPAALAFHLKSRTWSADRWQSEREELVHERSAAAQTGGGAPAAWDKAQGRLRYVAEFRVPSYAVADSDRLVVPLSLVHGRSEAEPSLLPRRHAVYVDHDERDEEILLLRMPSGYRVAELPEAVLARSAPIDGVLDVQVVAPDTIRVRRVLQLHAGSWQPPMYESLAEVMRKLAAGRQRVIVLERRR